MTDTAQLRALLAKMTPGTLVAAGWGDGSTLNGMINIFNEDAEVLLMECIPEHDAAGIVALVNAAEPMLDEIERLRAEVARLREAVTPSGSTKAAYHGEFTFELYRGVSNAGIDQYEKVYVPWNTVKQIMAAIAARAALGEQP